MVRESIVVSSNRAIEQHSTEESIVPVGIAVLVLAVVTSICYSNSFRGPFVFDDDGAIVYNESIRDLSNLRAVLTEGTYCTVGGRPLLNLSLAVNYWLCGIDNVFDYHLFNLIVHLLAALALFGVVRRTMRLPGMPNRIQNEANGLSFAIALIWAVHPLQTESVTYIVQRAESMVSAFYLFTLYCFIRAVTGRRPTAWYIASVVTCVLGMSTKEVMATAPVLTLLYDRVFLCPSFSQIVKQRWGYYVALAATWVWLVVLVLSSKGHEGTAGFGMGMSSWDYAMTQFGFIVRYLRLTVWPYPLVLDYGTHVARTIPEIVPYAAIVVGLLIASIAAFKFRPWIGFLGFSFFLILSPTSTIVPIVTQTGSEHRMYLPLAPLVVLLVMLAWRLVDLIARRFATNGVASSSVSSNLRRGTLILVVATFGYMTYQRNFDYRSELSIWKQASIDYPSNARAHCTVGTAYLKLHQINEAIEPLSRAIELRPGWASAHKNRGHAYMMLGQFEQAAEDFRSAAEASEHGSAERAQMYFLVGNCLGILGRKEESLECLRLALEEQPDHSEARSLMERLK